MKNKNFLITTTNNLEGYTVDQYLGMVSGEVILGANFFRDLSASITDFMGGRGSAYERTFVEAKTAATAEIVERAQEMGANAILAADLDFETLGQNNSMMMVSISGTAVVVRRNA